MNFALFYFDVISTIRGMLLAFTYLVVPPQRLRIGKLLLALWDRKLQARLCLSGIFPADQRWYRGEPAA